MDKDHPSFSSPDIPADDLLEWYRANRRRLPWRDTVDLYHILVSEVMLQQTQVKTVIPYYHRFLENFPTVGDLAGASSEKVLKSWEGLGYYSRARNLHRAAIQIMEKHQGRIPDDQNILQKLPGIGPYIGAAILSIGYHQPVPVVDGNVLRVFARYYNFGEDIRKTGTRNTVFNRLQTIIPGEAPGDFNQAMMELGALVCTPRRPDCPSCPLQTSCRANELGLQEKLPFRSPSATPPVHKVSMGILIHEGSFFIQQRPSEGHLGGMWEFPGGKSLKNETPIETVQRECMEELGVSLPGFKYLTEITHQYTHFGIGVKVFTCRLTEKFKPVTGRPFRWISFGDIGSYPRI